MKTVSKRRHSPLDESDISLNTTETALDVEIFFNRHGRMRSLIRSALDAHQGQITVDDPASPSIALLIVGRFIAVGGAPSHPALGVLLRQQPAFWIIAENEAWQQTIHRSLGRRIKWRDRIRFEADTLSSDHLAQYLSTPQGYTIEPIDQETMALLTRPDRSTGAFPNADAFLKHGLGYCVLYDGQPVGFALSYATYNSGIEIDLWIHEAHRRQGLATTVSAHLITTCLDRGLEPHWDAANDESANLAENWATAASSTTVCYDACCPTKYLKRTPCP